MTFTALLIDDSPDVRALVARELQRQFAQVVVREAGDPDALAQAIDGGGFDIAITDYRLRFTDGITVLRELKRRYPGCPVIMFTASGNEEVAVEGMKEGLDDYITKTPKHYPRIGIAVRACLDKIDQRARLEQALARESLARESLERKSAQLEKANRQKNEFLSILAHELRNPLAAARYSIALLRTGGAAAATPSRALDVIDRQIGHMAKLLDELLDLSRIVHQRIDLDMRLLDLNRHIELGCENVRHVFEEKGHAFTLRLSPEPLWVTGDEVRLAQVFANLLGNAVKFTSAPGRIAMRVSRDAAQAVIEVVDDGIGIDPERLEDVFEMFAQAQAKTHGGAPGLGIGLAVVRSLVELHGGSVRAFSAGRGQGTRIEARLPLAPAPQETAQPDAGGEMPDGAAAAAMAPRRVLIADDNVDAAELLAQFLQLSGHDVHVATDGQAAMRLAADVRPEVMLLDIGMPGANGYEVASWVREQSWGGGVLLVAVTGWGREQDGDRALQAGFDRRLVKPVEMAQLQALLQTPPQAV